MNTVINRQVISGLGGSLNQRAREIHTSQEFNIPGVSMRKVKKQQKDEHDDLAKIRFLAKLLQTKVR